MKRKRLRSAVKAFHAKIRLAVLQTFLACFGCPVFLTAMPTSLAKAFLLTLAVSGSGICSAAGLSLDATMDERSARAMLTRFGYGVSPASLTATMKQSPRQYLLRAIQQDSVLPPAVLAEIRSLPISQPLDAVWQRLGPGGTARGEGLDANIRKALRQEEESYASAATQARLLSMANSDNPGHEVLLSFWLNHFSIYAPKNLDKLLAWDYVRTLEEAMRADSFEALLRASFYHPAMQVYLDNAQSTAENSIAAQKARERGKTLGINENLARELLELHTLGVDSGYTQKDVQELARIITGAGIYSFRMLNQAQSMPGTTRMGLFLFDPRRHDYGEKNFLGNYFPAGQGIAEIDRALHLLATHPATAKRISLKLARRFLSDDPPLQVVDAMTEAYLRSDGKISATLLSLLESDAFAASLVTPTKFKEPVDYVLSVARAACGDTPINNGPILAAITQDMGQAPLMRTTPDGYADEESAWLSPAAMAKRIRLAISVAAGKVPFASGEGDAPTRLKALADAGNGWMMRGTACRVDVSAVERAVGPLSPSTEAVAKNLSERERVGLLLASPEFMRR